MARPTPRTTRTPRRRVGFTLAELTVTVTIAGLLALIAVPMVRSALRRYALEDAAEHLAADLVRAQTLAIKMNRSVTVYRVGLTAYKVDAEAAYALPNAVRFTGSSPASVTFASFGPPTTGAATFTLQWETRTHAVVVNAAGKVSR